MPEDSPFSVPWWYRREFYVAQEGGETVTLKFDGINYRANVWLNGKLIANGEEIVGSYREFELDISQYVRRSGPNVLAIEISPPKACELAITWVDWNPSPPDKNMGIWRDVWLWQGGPVTLRDPHVLTRLEDDGSATLTVAADLANRSKVAQTTTVCGKLPWGEFAKEVELAPGETRRVEISVDEAKCLHVQKPELWWPRQMGLPALHAISLEARVDGKVSDGSEFDFGIRTVEGYLTEDKKAGIKVNGEPVLVRGAGWATDLFLRRDRAREWAQIDYVLEMNLNTIRFEGMLEREEFLERCDREGLMVISGWCCCDQWEKWADWKQENFLVAPESLRSQIKRVRRYPCMIAWWYGSDFAPPPEVEKSYVEVLEAEAWPNAAHSSASHRPSELTGDCGMKMEGPYEYVPPNYWYEDKERGGAHGFATEICPGPAVPPIESLRRMLPEENLWPIDEVWNYHAGGQEFHNIEMFTRAVTERHGECPDVETFAQLSQLVTYEAQRSMFEAYTRKKNEGATGVVQWMLNNAWPSLIWHLYDYYLRPAGGYFGTKKACEPVHALYAYDDRSVVVDNQGREDLSALRVAIRVYDLDSKLIHEVKDRIDVPASGQNTVAQLPSFDDAGSLVFVDLRLHSASGEELSQNFYWIPKKLDQLDHEKGTWYYTPVTEHADLRALRDLPGAEVAVRAEREGSDELVVDLENTGDALAFFTQLRLCDAEGEDILPVLYSDNYVSVLPGESRRVTLRLPDGADIPQGAALEVHGMNVAKRVVELVGGKGGGGGGRAVQAPVDADVLLFGATGDLAYRKLFRALYHLRGSDVLGKGTSFYGFGRRPLGGEGLRARTRSALLETLPPAELDEELVDDCVKNWHYVQLDSTGSSFAELAKTLEESAKNSPVERERIIYLALASEYYGPLCAQMAAAGILTPNTRVVLEKPIGEDADTAIAVNQAVAEFFEERQIYRIDHYLGKETVQNLLALRFANVLFEPLWRSSVVEEVQITVAEDMGVEDRLGFYDETGALRDMVQSHLLQLLCLVAMEVPRSLEPDAVREEKRKVLQALSPIVGKEVDRLTVRGQYEGYGSKLDAPSETESFVAIKAAVANWRWAGVPFYLRTGKHMAQRASRIVLKFREVPQSIFPHAPAMRANRLVLRLQPDDGIHLEMMAKSPGQGLDLQNVDLSLDFHQVSTVRRPYSYERLLRDAVRGESTLFLHRDEIELAWKWVDPIAEQWRARGRAGLHSYARGSFGPVAAERLVETREGWDNTTLET
jgi:exo-1,4-beta-D-glucosaminidase